jgi:hypothetical protein
MDHNPTITKVVQKTGLIIFLAMPRPDKLLLRSFSDLRVLVFHLDLIKKFIKHVVILKGRHIWWSAYHNSDICLGWGILNIPLLGKSSKVAGF